MSIARDDIVKRTLSRIIEAFDDGPTRPYSIAEVVARASAEPAISPMLRALETLDQHNVGWNVADHVRRYMHNTAAAILRSTDALGRHTHGSIQGAKNEPTRYFSMKVFVLAQIQAMRLARRRLARHVMLQGDGLEELERLIVLHDATTAGDVWDFWHPLKVVPPEAAAG
jgi:hypothetical protein